MAAYACPGHREEAPSRFAGQLNPLEQERFDAHQRACPTCRAFFETYTHALTAARAEPPLPTVDEKDRAYAALMARLDRGGDAASPPRERRPRRWRWAAAALAGAAAAIAAFGLAPRGAEPTVPAPALVSVPARPGLDVRAETGTEWRLEEHGPETRLVLRRGVVFVRLAPLAPPRTFVVDAPDLDVLVTGTVLSVRSDGERRSEVAVMRGSVIVAREGRRAVLVAGEIQRGGARGLLARDGYAPVGDWLGTPEVAAEPEPEPPPPATPVTAVTPPPPPTPRPQARPRPVAPAPPPAPDPVVVPAYADAERALAAGDLPAAAGILEALVAAQPDGSAADTARLELATLYAGPLDRRVDARRHLRVFLARSPNAAGAGAARALLCRIALDDLTCRR